MEEGEIPPTQEEQEEEEDVVETGTTTGDCDVRERDPFTSESAQILIGEIMGCNVELQNIQKKINDVIQKNNNIIDVLGPYPNTNIRKAKIMAKVVKSLHRNFGVQRSKDQLRKRWSDLKLREPEQYRKIQRVLQKVTSCAVFLFFLSLLRLCCSICFS
ncbi:hypothetical protein AB205_0063160 [Aquarana catesbeiana]|uniref:Uncharacterized protein n=1 Tax=Aquarana catesbeiana TaxID=8400 RepID=A0A2G9Q2Z3_AQUCT|nr:hypothetical protein AB205_0063160 [Aquarana catesbeiana]